MSSDTTPGYRGHASGGLSYVCSHGYVWSAAVCEANGMNLSFNATGVDACSLYGRAVGFQLRCLSE